MTLIFEHAAVVFDVQRSVCVRCKREWIGPDTDPSHLCESCIRRAALPAKVEP